MSTRRSTKRWRKLPYSYDERGVSLDVVGVWVDGQSVSVAELVDSTQRQLRLDAVDHWQQVELEVEAAIATTDLDALVPPSERSEPPVEFWIVARCPKTFGRWGEPLALSRDAESLRARGRIHLRSDAVSEQGSFQTHLIRSVAARSDSPGQFASRRGARLATGPQWVLRFDVPRSVLRHHLDVRYQSFSRASYDELARFPKNLYFLECDGERPILWLNEDHGAIADILNSEGTTGLGARTREVFFDAIGQAVWLQLLVNALHALDDTLETHHPWQSVVLDELLPDILPDAGDSCREQAKEIFDELGAGWFVGVANSTLQARHRMAEHMLRLLEEVA